MKKENGNSNDEQLWQAVRAGDEEAFECLYRQYFRDLFHYGRRFMRDEEAVNDAIQDLFVDLWRTRRSLSPARSVKFYLMISLRRKIYRTLRTNPEFTTDNWEEFPEAILPVQPSAETFFLAQEAGTLQTEKLSAWLEQLPSRQREALVLRFYHDLEYAEIASLLDIAEQTSRNLVQKALSTLRRFSVLLIFLVLKFIF